jgi:hypothetical protein
MAQMTAEEISQELDKVLQDMAHLEEDASKAKESLERLFEVRRESMRQRFAALATELAERRQATCAHPVDKRQYAGGQNYEWRSICLACGASIRPFQDCPECGWRHG